MRSMILEERGRKMAIKIALAGNPNCGKTTLFNALTGSNQFVGNWPGVTVEKKEGKLKKQYGGNGDDVIIMDLPGIYSLSPYTLEEVVARNYLIGERPDAILNLVDGTNIERNLYLSTQLMELGIPVVMAVNMIDIVNKNGDKINVGKLSEKLGCPVVEISALKLTGIENATKKAIELAQKKSAAAAVHKFAPEVESVIETVEKKLTDVPEEQKRFFAIKLLEKDDKIQAQMKSVPDVSAEIKQLETVMDDDTESIITNERYTYISSIIKECYTKKEGQKLTTSDKIDKIVTNRWLALPIFAVVMFIVYYVSVTTVGTWATDWANDGVFGDGWHLFTIGTGAYEEAAEPYDDAMNVINAFVEADGDEALAAVIDSESEDYDPAAAVAAVQEFAAGIDASATAEYTLEDEETLATEDVTYTGAELAEAVDVYVADGGEAPDPADYGIWVPGIPVLLESGLDAIGCADWLKGLILDGIVAGVGAVLGFVPQMLVLFIFLAFLESCGYMARIAFIMDRIFRKFGLSGKSFIPMLIGSGCGVPGIMASRTIESDRDRKMTIMTTTFIPCGAKMPIIGLIAAAVFGGSAWIATSAYFIGVAAIVISGIMLKKTKMFAGDPAPFVMELPAYHFPSGRNVFHSVWERGWSFIKRAGTVILLSSIVIWFAKTYGWAPAADVQLEAQQTYQTELADYNAKAEAGTLEEDEEAPELAPEMEEDRAAGSWGAVADMDNSILGKIGNPVSVVFKPLGFGNMPSTVATVMGLVAKEEVVGVLGVLYGADDAADVVDDEDMTEEEKAEALSPIATAFNESSNGHGRLAAYAFMIFNLLCAPCFAAIGAMKREFNNAKWTLAAVGYQCAFAYTIALIVYQLGLLFSGAGFTVATAIAILLLAGLVYLVVRKNPYNDNHLTQKVSA